MSSSAYGNFVVTPLSYSVHIFLGVFSTIVWCLNNFCYIMDFSYVGTFIAFSCMTTDAAKRLRYAVFHMAPTRLLLRPFTATTVGIQFIRLLAYVTMGAIDVRLSYLCYNLYSLQIQGL